MRELRDILAAMEGLEELEGAVLASVVHTEGSTYRRPGARLLVLPDDTMIGLISGGCLEGDLLAHAAEVRSTGRPRLVRYDATRDDDVLWGLGLGCAGIVDVLLEPITNERRGPLGWLGAWRAACARGAIATSLDEEQLGRRWALHADGRLEGAPASDALRAALRDARARGRSRRLVTPEGVVAIEGVHPPLRLVVFGAGPDAAPVARLALAQGWNVELADHRPAHAKPDRFPGAQVHCVAAEEAVARVGVNRETYVLVMTHHYLHDRAILAGVLASQSPYVGLLGPKRRAEDLLADLAAQGVRFSDDDLACLHAPAGLDLGGDGPEAIALSVVGEILAVARGRSGGWLRDRKGPINDPEIA
jgi:xanthine/CO dehydrogenase XdhC/CoxF family maturation factor